MGPSMGEGAIEVRCECGARLAAPEGTAGRPLRCPRCGRTIPEAAESLSGSPTDLGSGTVEGAAINLGDWDPESAPLDADVIGAAAFQAYRAGRFATAIAHLARYFARTHREAEGRTWLARARLLASLEPELPPGDLARLLQANPRTLAAVDPSDRSRVERALGAWKEKHPDDTTPPLPW
ncbi:MAG: hypothetical protein HY720_00830 [Planctomycetes bacterium]|nr:hypothetical protein [Planctomycetota bacterium]